MSDVREVMVAVAFCGGPLEGEVREMPYAALVPRRLVPVYRRSAVLALLARAGAPRPDVVRHAVYVLHRYGRRYEYVHDGTGEG